MQLAAVPPDAVAVAEVLLRRTQVEHLVEVEDAQAARGVGDIEQVAEAGDAARVDVDRPVRPVGLGQHQQRVLIFERLGGLRNDTLMPRSPAVGRKYQLIMKAGTPMFPESSLPVRPWGYQSAVSWSLSSKAYQMSGLGFIEPIAAAAPLFRPALLALASTASTAVLPISPASLSAPSARSPVARFSAKGAVSVDTIPDAAITSSPFSVS
ncbi:hypothetical protein [Nonomuraea salmonea]|uniref:hypothetical protein n=1 Tax=Nonomuraea salmonea TaxID=46181 RepID=UPI002FE71D69